MENDNKRIIKNSKNKINDLLDRINDLNQKEANSADPKIKNSLIKRIN